MPSKIFRHVSFSPRKRIICKGGAAKGQGYYLFTHSISPCLQRRRGALSTQASSRFSFRSRFFGASALYPDPAFCESGQTKQEEARPAMLSAQRCAGCVSESLRQLSFARRETALVPAAETTLIIPTDILCGIRAQALVSQASQVTSLLLVDGRRRIFLDEAPSQVWLDFLFSSQLMAKWGWPSITWRGQWVCLCANKTNSNTCLHPPSQAGPEKRSKDEKISSQPVKRRAIEGKSGVPIPAPRDATLVAAALTPAQRMPWSEKSALADKFRRKTNLRQFVKGRNIPTEKFHAQYKMTAGEADEGSFGLTRVFSVPHSTRLYRIKKVDLPDEEAMLRFRDEVALNELLGGDGPDAVAPAFHDAFVVLDGSSGMPAGYLVNESYDMSLHGYLRKHPLHAPLDKPNPQPAFAQMFMTKLQRLADSGYMFWDLKPQNVVVDGRLRDVRFIDWDLSFGMFWPWAAEDTLSSQERFNLLVYIFMNNTVSDFRHWLIEPTWKMWVYQVKTATGAADIFPKIIADLERLNAAYLKAGGRRGRSPLYITKRYGMGTLMNRDIETSESEASSPEALSPGP